MQRLQRISTASSLHRAVHGETVGPRKLKDPSEKSTVCWMILYEIYDRLLKY